MAEVVDAIDDDAVLAAPDEGEAAVVEAAEVAAAEPAVGGEGVPGGLLVVVVARGDHGSGELEFTGLARPQFAVVLVDDPQPQALHRGAEVGELLAWSKAGNVRE